MMLNVKLSDYLKDHFPNMLLESPLFYNAPIGIRFELGVAYRQADTTYFANIFMRSNTIFHEVFKPEDDILVVVNSYQSVKPYLVFNQGEDVFPKYIKNMKIINLVNSIDIEKFFEENGDLSGTSYQQTLMCRMDDIDYAGILKAKAHQDFSISPYISDAVFFINLSKHVIFYMYDHRGMDLVAESKESLLPIYMKFNEWILDYDRERIDIVFKEKFIE